MVLDRMESTPGAQKRPDTLELQQVHYSWSASDTAGVDGRLQVSEYGILWHHHPSAANHSGIPEEVRVAEAEKGHENGDENQANLYDEAVASEVIDLKTAFEVSRYATTQNAVEMAKSS